MKHSGDLTQFGLKCDKITKTITDNVKYDLMPVDNMTCMGVIAPHYVLASGALITEIHWAATGTQVEVTPQLSNASASGDAEFLILWKK